MAPVGMTECAKELAALKELMLEMFSARDKAIDVAAIAMADRLEGMNEFRNQLTAQAAKFITRMEHEAVLGQLGALQARQSAQETRLLLGGAGIVIVLTMLQLFFNYAFHR